MLMPLLRKSVITLLTLMSLAAYAEVIPVYQIDQAQDTYVQTTIDHDIYRYSANPQLSDLVILDSQGNKLPYRVSPFKQQSSAQVQQTPLRYFPVAVGAPPETLLALSSASIRLDDNEISVSVEKKANPQLQNTSAPIDFFIVDLSDLKQRIDLLKIDWNVDESNQYLEVEVSGTNDLTNWTSITKTTLVQLQKQEQSLIRNRIPLHLAEMQYAYLRLKFTRAGDHFGPTTITAENSNITTNKSVIDTWEIKGELAEKQTSAYHGNTQTKNTSVVAWEFQREDIAPVDHISLQLGQLMYGDNIRIFSRANAKQEWQLVHQGIWFNILVGDAWQHGDEIPGRHNTDMLWRVELNPSVRETAQPVLILHRQPEVLQFIANNAAPYQIAIETDQQLQSQEANRSIFFQLVSGKKIDWVHADFRSLSPDIKRFARHETIISWRTLVFWGILFIALGLLIFLALRLMKQISKSSETELTN